jgi:four helix bundle protein
MIPRPAMPIALRMRFAFIRRNEEARMQDFRNLQVWQKAHKLALKAYGESAPMVRQGHFALRNQLTRAALSVPANLAEGCGRTGDRDLRRFIRIALGSASELEYHLLFARDLGLLPERAYEELTGATTEVKRMLTGLASRLTDQIRKAEAARDKRTTEG